MLPSRMDWILGIALIWIFFQKGNGDLRQSFPYI
jgi:hypothetical protein